MGVLETIAAVLVVLWLAGFAFHIGGALINLLIIAAVVVFAMRFFRRAV